MNADMVVVLDGGEVAGFGTHDQLVQTNVMYRKLVQHQLPTAMPPLVQVPVVMAAAAAAGEPEPEAFLAGEL